MFDPSNLSSTTSHSISESIDHGQQNIPMATSIHRDQVAQSAGEVAQNNFQVHAREAADLPRQHHTVQVRPQGFLMRLIRRITNRVTIGNERARQEGDEQTRFLRRVMLEPSILADNTNNSFCYWNANEVNFQSGHPPRNIEGIYFRSTSPASITESGTKQAILLCTGNNLPYEKYALPMIQSLTELGHDVMVFNYSGFGGSEGTRTEEHVYEDTVNAFDEMQRQAVGAGIPPENMKAIGYSLGGAAAAYLATERNVDVVLDRTFTRASDTANTFLERMGIPRFLRAIAQSVFRRVTKFDTLSRLPSLRGRCMVVKGEQDIMPAITREMINNQANRAQFTFLENVNVEHLHDPIGKRILSDVEFPPAYQHPEDSRELWYGAARPSPTGEPSTQERHRAQLDDWLRGHNEAALPDEDD